MVIVAITAATMASVTPAMAQGNTASTQQEKDGSQELVVFAGPWNDYPFCYINDRGEPTGLEVEILKAIFKKADIPYRIVLKDFTESNRMVAQGQADIGIGCRQLFGDSVFYSPIILFTTQPVIAYPEGQPHTKNFTDLATTPIITGRNSFMALELKTRGWYHDSIATDDPMHTMLQILADGKGEMVSNADRVQWLKKKYNVKIAMADINMPLEERRLAGRDKQTLSTIENIYKVMKSDGTMDRLVNNWYHEEQQVKMPFDMWIVVALLAAAIAAMLAFVVMHNRKEKALMEEMGNQTRRFQTLQNASNSRIWTYDLNTRHFIMYDKNLKPDEYITWDRYVGNMPRSGYKALTQAMHKIRDGESDEENIRMTVPHDTSHKQDEETEIGIRLAVLKEKNGKPEVIVGTQFDTAKEITRMQHHQLVMQYYQVVFENGLIDLCLFTPEGEMLKYNQHFRQTFDIRDLSKAKKHVSETDFYYFFDKDYVNLLPAVTSANGMHYRSSFIPILDNDGKLVCVCGRGVDVTDSVETYKQNREETRKLSKALQEKEKLADQAKYAITSGRTFLFSYDPDKRNFTSYEGIDEPSLTYSEIQCLQGTHPDSQDEIMNLMYRMDNKDDISFSSTVRTKMIPASGEGNVYLSFTVSPQKDDNGDIIGYRGTYTGATKMVLTQKMLEEEHERALEAEHVKSAFLKNMSYEIRVPLNTIVGFADLLTTGAPKEDEEFFVKEIQESTTDLLAMVNDSLYLSRMDANMVTPALRSIEFVEFFEHTVNTIWHKYQHEGVKLVIQNNYKHITAVLDTDMCEIILDNFISNAAKHTIAGTVRVAFEYHGGIATVSVEDTGNGMSEEAQKHVFDRFYKGDENDGTGLGLSICKAITELLGGKIGIESIPGQGTMAWVSIPMEVTEVTKKTINQQNEGA